MAGGTNPNTISNAKSIVPILKLKDLVDFFMSDFPFPVF